MNEQTRPPGRTRPAWLLPLVATGFFVLLWLLSAVLPVDLDGFVAGLSEGDRAPAAALIVLLLAADVVAPVPNVPVIVLAGAVFDVALGTALVVAGSMIASALAYALGRYAPGGLARRLADAQQLADIKTWIEGSGRWLLAVARAVPILAEVLGVAAGASRMPFGPFIGWTLAGTIPICFCLVAAGSLVETAESALLLVGVVVVVSLMLNEMLNLTRRRTSSKN